MQLHPFQEDWVTDIQSKLLESKSVLAVGATGLGKTCVASAIMHRWLDRPQGEETKILFLVSQTCLLEQTIDKLRRFDIDVLRDVGVIAGAYSTKIAAPIQIVSLQALAARKILDDMDIALAIWDEAHSTAFFSISEQIRSRAQYHLGFTASPCRLSSKEYMGQHFKTASLTLSHKQAVEQGFLVGWKFFRLLPPDFSGAKVSMGDYTEASIDKIVKNGPTIKLALDGWLECSMKVFGELKPTLIFANSVAHCTEIVDFANKLGFSFKAITAETPTQLREQYQEHLASSKIHAIVSVRAITTGFDCPEARVLLDMAPTLSWGLHTQKYGRVARTAAAKDFALIIDAVGNLTEHGSPDAIEWDETSVLAPRVRQKRQKKPCDSCGATDFSIIGEGEEGICSVCGGLPVLPKIVGEHVKPKAKKKKLLADGSYVEYDPGAEKEECFAYWRKLCHQALERGYKPAWVKFRFVDKYPQYSKKVPNGIRYRAFTGDGDDYTRENVMNTLRYFEQSIGSRDPWWEKAIDQEFGDEKGPGLADWWRRHLARSPEKISV